MNCIRKIFFHLVRCFNRRHLSPFKPNDYSCWVARNDKIIENFADNETFKVSIIIPVYNPVIVFLEKAINSCTDQTYKNFEIIIVDDCSDSKKVNDLLDLFSKKFHNIHVFKNASRKNISETLNYGIQKSSGEWVCFLDHDDMLRAGALVSLHKEVLRDKKLKVVYSDEDKVDYNDIRCEPNFKPSLNLGLLLSQNYICHLLFVRHDVLKKNLFRRGYEGAQDWDLCLRLFNNLKRSEFYHIPRILYHWRAHKNSTANNISVKIKSVRNAAPRALKSFLKNKTVDASINKQIGNHWKLDYNTNEFSESVDIIYYGMKPRCLSETIRKLLNNTNYENFKIYIPESWCDRDTNFLKWTKSENILNQFSGEYVLFIENGLIPKVQNWLYELIKGTQNDEVGFVGPRLFYLDSGRNFSSGMCYYDGSIHSLYNDYENDFPGLHYRMHLNNSFIFLHPSCLLIKKKLLNSINEISNNSLIELLFHLNSIGKYNNYIASSECYVSEVHSSYSYKKYDFISSLKKQGYLDLSFNTNLKIINGKIYLR